jgi:hypothetical protein
MLKSLANWFKPKHRAPKSPSNKGEGQTLIVTHAEVCNSHGTGSLLRMTFGRERMPLVFYSRAYFGQNTLGDGHHLQHEQHDWKRVQKRVAESLKGRVVERIFSVPFYPDDALTTLAVQEQTGAPFAMYIMDDQNVFCDGIPDDLMNRLVGQAGVRFTISETLRAAYQEKFGVPFWILPPIASESFFAPMNLVRPSGQEPRGVLIGNIWSLDVLQDLRSLIQTARLKIDWYGNAGKPFIQLDPEELRSEGISLHPSLNDEQLVPELRRFDYAIMPSGNLEGGTHDWLFRASLPSRVIYLFATANLPIIVLGSPETEAARFVTGAELGGCSPYEAEEFRRLVQRVTEPDRSTRIRERARLLAPSFGSNGVADWIWNSLRLGRAADDRYERLFAQIYGRPSAMIHHGEHWGSKT